MLKFALLAGAAVLLFIYAVTHGNWIGGAVMVFYLVLLWLWRQRKVDLGYAFRKGLPLAWVVLAAGGLFIVSEILHGCSTIMQDVDTEERQQQTLPDLWRRQIDE